MFTGIITHIANVKNISSLIDQDLLIGLELENRPIDRDIKIGCSISCNGICLTLVEKLSYHSRLLLNFQVSLETLNKTNIKNWKIGNKINLEFSLRIGDELGGNMVIGHIDDTSLVQKIKAINNDSWQFIIKTPKNLKKFIAPKGSIVLNGVSLTVNEVTDNIFSINIIKHTFNNTNFNKLKVGDYLNLEVDLIARHLDKLLKNK